MKLADEYLDIPTPLQTSKNERSFFEELCEKEASLKALPQSLSLFIESVFSLSPYLKTCATRDATFFKALLSNGFESNVNDIQTEVETLGLTTKTEAELMARLRVLKRQMAFLCGFADLGGWWSDAQVTLCLSNFANSCLNASLDFIFIQQHEAGKLTLQTPERPQELSGLVVLGMGKLGAGELNYSSDIDLILFYEEASGMTLNTDDPITLLSRLAKQLIKIMQERTPDGYVFRTDLRLRPDPSSTPLILPVVAALNYYEGHGQNWERAAMIKAAAVAGDLQAGEAFLKELSPFIWRKYLDYAAINDIHSIKRQIHAHKGLGEITVSGHNVKLGRGGIREIEFFVQTQQLIAGGRNLQLRTNQTIQALHELAKLGWITPQAVDDLTGAYWFLRKVEHRLQMIADEQTHTLPTDAEGLCQISDMCGFKNPKIFAKQLRETLTLVSGYYSDLFETSDNLSVDQGSLVFTGDDNDPETLKTLEQMGYRKPDAIVNMVKHWHVARIPALRTTTAREMLTELVPVLLAAFGETEKPDEAIILFDRFISGLPAGIQLFSILQNNPAISGLLLKILTAAPKLGQQIAQKPHIFDAMLDPSFASNKNSKRELLERINGSLARAPDYEAALDAGRRFFGEASFLYGCQFFSGILSLEQIKLAFSNLGDVMVSAMYECVCREFEKRHGKIKGAQVCVLGMGRLGSRELTATSDLDLIFLYDHSEAHDVSDGEKQLPASVYFTRLMQRFITAMSSPTSEGIIYNLDFRLRPSGNAGPLATHVDGFLKYQREEAWVWEAQAITRARAIAGNTELMERVRDEIPEIIKIASKRDDLKTEIKKMRLLLDKEKPAASIWDVKSGAGGLGDIEFVVQYFTICGKAPNAMSCSDAIASLKDGVLSSEQHTVLSQALDIFEHIIHLQRICLGDGASFEDAPMGFEKAITAAFDLPNMNVCKAHLKELRKSVRRVFLDIIA